MIKRAIRNVLTRMGYDLQRTAPAAPPANLVEQVCAKARVPVLKCLEQEAYAKLCAPLLPQPTRVPPVELGFYRRVEDALRNVSMEQYFQVEGSGEQFRLNDVYPDSHYFSRQRMLASAYQAFLPGGLAGHSLLDIGCSSGYYSFYAARLGASDVLGIDARPEHADQFRLLHTMLGLDARCAYRHVDMEQQLEQIERPYDVVLAQGVMYHTYDHPRFIRNLRRLTGKLLILEGGCSGRADFLCKADLERQDHLRASIHGPVLYPSVPWMMELLRWAGFRELHYVALPPGIPDRWGFSGLHRAMVAAVV